MSARPAQPSIPVVIFAMVASACEIVGGIPSRDLATCDEGDIMCQAGRELACDADGEWTEIGTCDSAAECDEPDGKIVDDPAPDDCHAIACFGGRRIDVSKDDAIQIPGDCKKIVCNGFDRIVVNDDSDATDNGDACLLCQGGVQLPGDFPCLLAQGAPAYYTCVIRADRSVWCWGKNDTGQLGRGMVDSFAHPDPEAVGGLPKVSFLVSGEGHSCAIAKDDGALWCWGSNKDGQLGGTAVLANPTPKVVDLGGKKAIHVAAGFKTTCVVLEDTTVRCWGTNDLGQLGDGTTVAKSTPTPVLAARGTGQLEGAVEVATGTNSTCALLEDGTVSCWGSTAVGDGSSSASWPLTRPVHAILPGPATMVRAGDFHTVAVLDSGDVACWGSSGLGECGTQVPAFPWIVTTPRLLGLDDVTTAGAGWRIGCALSDVVTCWGLNAQLALGNGSQNAMEIDPPTKVVGLPGKIDALGVFWQHACALSGKDLYCWGSNISGEIGAVTTVGVSSATALKMPWPGR